MILVALMIVFQVVIFTMGFIAGVIYGRRRSAARLAAARYVADDSPSLWGWIIFPEGFDAPQLMGLAKLQAWTLKPAMLAAAVGSRQ